MSFNPSKFSTSYTESYVEDESIEITPKGHKNKIVIDLSEIEKLCKKFKTKTELKIKELSNQDNEDFKTIVAYTEMIHDTEYYSDFYEKVRNVFKNVKSVVPGTIGAYFAGCLVTTQNGEVNPGCSATCAGSMPLPKDEEGWSFCDKAVILAEKIANKHNFNVVKPADSESDLDPAYVFIESSSLDTFSGFTKTEKDDLRAMGCEKVHLIGYDTHGSQSYDLYGEPKYVNEIKHKHVYKPHKKKKEKSNWVIGVIVIILILLALAAFGGYSYYMNKQ